MGHYVQRRVIVEELPEAPVVVASYLLANYGYNKVMKLAGGSIEKGKENLAKFFIKHDKDITQEQASYLANVAMKVLQTAGQIAVHQVAATKFNAVRKGSQLKTRQGGIGKKGGVKGSGGKKGVLGSLNITAKNASVSEVRAANYMKNKGFNVELRDPLGTRVGGGTSDLLVDGITYDIYTPLTANPNAIISAIAKKNTQASGIVLDLSNTSVTQNQLGNILKRVQGAGATSIRDIQIIERN